MTDYGNSGSSRSNHRAMQVVAHLHSRGVKYRDFANMHPTELATHASQAGMTRALSAQEVDLVGRGLKANEENAARFAGVKPPQQEEDAD